MSDEIEIKIDLVNRENYEKLFSYFDSPAKEVRQINHFFDNESLELLNIKWALRIRQQDEKYILTLKGPRQQSPEGLSIRKEYETDIDGDSGEQLIQEGINIDNLPRSVGERLSKLDISGHMNQILMFSNTRTNKYYDISGNRLKLEFDKTAFADNSIDYELEIELKSAGLYQSVMIEMARIFKGLDIGLVEQKMGKFSRALIKSGFVGINGET